MSHSRERKEKVCLNCAAELYGRYCQVCGQENVEPRQSFWSLVTHFFEDITHFDGKFFKTVGLLSRRPGFLPSEYIIGRRARYLHPIRMYIFTSAVFFLVFYSIAPAVIIDPVNETARQINTDSLVNAGTVVNADTVVDADTVVNADRAAASDIPLLNELYATTAQYDSAQQTKPVGERDSWLERKLMYRSIRMNQKYQGRPRDLLRNMAEGLIHMLPYLLFVSLPLYAFYLKLLYIRKKYLYTDHAIFLIYLYIFTFILLLVVFGLSALDGIRYIGWLDYLKYPLLLYGVVYTVTAMKRFYVQGTAITFVKFVIFNILALVTVVILFILFLLLTLFRI